MSEVLAGNTGVALIAELVPLPGVGGAVSSVDLSGALVGVGAHDLRRPFPPNPEVNTERKDAREFTSQRSSRPQRSADWSAITFRPHRGRQYCRAR